MREEVTYPSHPTWLGDWFLNWLCWRLHTDIFQHPPPWQDLCWVGTLLGKASSSLWVADSGYWRSSEWRFQCQLWSKWRPQRSVLWLWCWWLEWWAVSQALQRNRQVVVQRTRPSFYSSHVIKPHEERSWTWGHRFVLCFVSATQAVRLWFSSWVFCVSISL